MHSENLGKREGAVPKALRNWEETWKILGNQQKFIRTMFKNPLGDPRENGRGQCSNH